VLPPGRYAYPFVADSQNYERVEMKTNQKERFRIKGKQIEASNVTSQSVWFLELKSVGKLFAKFENELLEIGQYHCKQPKFQARRMLSLPPDIVSWADARGSIFILHNEAPLVIGYRLNRAGVLELTKVTKIQAPQQHYS
jgi:hypothetical protein